MPNLAPCGHPLKKVSGPCSFPGCSEEAEVEIAISSKAGSGQPTQVCADHLYFVFEVVCEGKYRKEIWGEKGATGDDM